MTTLAAETSLLPATAVAIGAEFDPASVQATTPSIGAPPKEPLIRLAETRGPPPPGVVPTAHQDRGPPSA